MWEDGSSSRVSWRLNDKVRPRLRVPSHCRKAGLGYLFGEAAEELAAEVPLLVIVAVRLSAVADGTSMRGGCCRHHDVLGVCCICWGPGPGAGRGMASIHLGAQDDLGAQFPLALPGHC